MPLILDRPIVPPCLPNELPPTINQLKNSVQDWVSYSVRTMTLDNPHFENSFYGPWNALLSSVFPLKRGFMVKPQAILRSVVDQDDDVDLSFGSTGGVHRARTEREPFEFVSRDYKHLHPLYNVAAGRELGVKLPDFVVVKIDFRPNGFGDHKFVLVVEIKRNNVEANEAKLQLTAYLEKASKIQPEEVIYGYLICGAKVYKYRCCGNVDDDENPDVENFPMGDIFTPANNEGFEGLNFADDICDLAIHRWM